ncbi:MAG: hypothetical protein JWN03_6496 [Nocardia sp.]|nr:hypothetical protein [Nocardia sp.]
MLDIQRFLVAPQRFPAYGQVASPAEPLPGRLNDDLFRQTSLQNKKFNPAPLRTATTLSTATDHGLAVWKFHCA